MVCFLTSSIVIPGTEEMNPENRFEEELRQRMPQRCRMLFVCSDPDGHELTDFFAGNVRTTFEDAGFTPERFRILDGRNADEAPELVKEADLIILGGGHTPTQNRFFQKIGLRELMRGYDGIVIGISAGSMNSAETVYAQPEDDGESVDPEYRRFLPGLGLTETMILPHYQMVKDDILDGVRLFEDITYPDSMGRSFIALPDGSYLFCENGTEEIRGEAYLIRDGRLSQIAADGKTVSVP